MGSRRWARLDLLTAMDEIWGNYLKRLSAMPIKQQTAYAKRNGYSQPKELIAHLAAWIAETVRVMPYLCRDKQPPRDYTNDDVFNARVIERCRRLSRAEVEAEFRRQRLALKKLIAALPDDALQVTRVYRWLSETIISHYQDHQLPEWSLVQLRHGKQSNRGLV